MLDPTNERRPWLFASATFDDQELAARLVEFEALMVCEDYQPGGTVFTALQLAHECARNELAARGVTYSVRLGQIVEIPF